MLRRIIVAGITILLAACGGSAAPVGSPSAAAPAASKPAASQAAPASAKPASAAASAVTPVTVAYAQISNVHSPIFAAQELGYFTQNGLAASIKLVSGPAEAAALNAGELQFASLGGNEVIHADLGGADMVGIATLADVPVFSLYADKKYSSVTDLAGQTIAVTSLGTTTDATAQIFLKHYGMAGKVKIAGAGGTSAGVLATLTKGLVAGAIINPENSTTARDAGFVQLVDGVKLGEPMNYDVIGLMRPYLKDHPDVVRSFLRAYQQGWTFLGDPSHKAQAIAIAQKYTKSDDRLAEISYEAMLPVWSGKKVPDIDPRGLTSILDLSTEPGAKDAKPEQFIDNSIIQGIQAKGA